MCEALLLRCLACGLHLFSNRPVATYLGESDRPPVLRYLHPPACMGVLPLEVDVNVCACLARSRSRSLSLSLYTCISIYTKYIHSPGQGDEHAGT